jgi:hypothetical protein
VNGIWPKFRGVVTGGGGMFGKAVYHLQTSQDLVAGSAGDRLLIESEFVFAALWGDAQSAPTGEESD